MKLSRREYRSRVTKGESALKGKCENALSGQQRGVQEETLVVSGEVIVDKHHRDTDRRKKTLERFWPQGTKSFWKKWPESAHKKSSKEIVRIRPVIVGILPHV